MDFRPLCSDITITVPKRFGNYECIHKLGDGATSVVILAENRKTKKNVACKVFSRKMIMNEGKLALIEKELRVLERLKHPGIAKIEKIIYLDDLIIVAMEYCPNGTLYDYVVSHQCLPNWEVRKFARILLETLMFLHEKGIAHRDIKLDNIVLDENLEPKLIDFGLCIDGSDNCSCRQTICGTLEYMAPEIIGKKIYNPKASDIWALGVCIYTMAAGRFPWNGSVSHIINQIIFNNIVFTPNINQTTMQLIQMTLKSDPEERLMASDILSVMDQMDADMTPKISSSVQKSIRKMVIIKPISASLISNKLSFLSRTNIRFN